MTETKLTNRHRSKRKFSFAAGFKKGSGKRCRQSAPQVRYSCSAQNESAGDRRACCRRSSLRRWHGFATCWPHPRRATGSNVANGISFPRQHSPTVHRGNAFDCTCAERGVLRTGGNPGLHAYCSWRHHYRDGNTRVARSIPTACVGPCGSARSTNSMGGAVRESQLLVYAAKPRQ
jgi:hypothetical protein